jgi:hypothetical protein
VILSPDPVVVVPVVALPPVVGVVPVLVDVPKQPLKALTIIIIAITLTRIVLF